MSKITFNPVMQSPLHHFNLPNLQVNADNLKGVWANEIPLLGYISLRGSAQNNAFTKAVKKALGTALPTKPCSYSSTGWGSVLWLSPDEWLVICNRTQHATLLSALISALDGIHGQVVDNSGGFTSVLVQGKNASDVLHHCTVYDLDSLETGKVVGSTFGKVSLFLHKQDAAYRLVLRRSYADYIWRYLERSALPYGFG
jgi:sarcosine oxidase, subunit gamma